MHNVLMNVITCNDVTYLMQVEVGDLESGEVSLSTLVETVRQAEVVRRAVMLTGHSDNMYHAKQTLNKESSPQRFHGTVQT